jgi:hypothetical protein
MSISCGCFGCDWMNHFKTKNMNQTREIEIQDQILVFLKKANTIDDLLLILDIHMPSASDLWLDLKQERKDFQVVKKEAAERVESYKEYLSR